MTVVPMPPRSGMAQLNPAQREAVLAGERAVLVLAGAGSGKTRVLTSRVVHLIAERGVAPSEIMAVTFTNKAAGEMRDRIARALGAEPVGMWAGTFHAIGARVIRAHAHLVGRTPRFTIYDEDDFLGVVKRIMERLRLSPKERPPQAIVAAMSDAKNALVSPREYAAAAGDPFQRDVALVYNEIEPAMRQANAANFDDLLTLPVEILSHNTSVRERLSARFRNILIDEYQDTNRAQYRFAALVAGDKGDIMVVGDDDQSIYGWRGADIRNILDFERDFPDTRVIRLEENYRSTPQILAVANAAIKANTERLGKTLRATRAGGDGVTVIGTLDERDEADAVLTEIASRRTGSRARRLRDFAVLYRTNAQSRAFEEALRRQAIPYRLVGSVRFYDRREIRDLMAYLKLVANPSDDEAFRRAISVPRRGVGDTTLEALGSAAYDAKQSLFGSVTNGAGLSTVRPAARTAIESFCSLIRRLQSLAADASVDQLLREVIDSVGYIDYLRAEGPEGQDRIDNVRELVAGASESVVDDGGEVGLTPLDHFLQRAALVAGVDTLDPHADALTLMTLHNAKGLEFPVVFLTGLEEGLFPLARAREVPSQLEEERRLFYVGITRAEDTLFISHARGRRRNGEYMASMASSFLKEIPAALVTTRSTLKLRGSGRYDDERALGGFWGESGDDAAFATPHARRPGTPVPRFQPARAWAVEDESQDAPRFARGERVRHARFGSGTIAELSGSGRDAKVTVDFDDESVGRKRLVLAHAGLMSGDA